MLDTTRVCIGPPLPLVPWSHRGATRPQRRRLRPLTLPKNNCLKYPLTHRLAPAESGPELAVEHRVHCCLSKQRVVAQERTKRSGLTEAGRVHHVRHPHPALTAIEC